MEQGWAQLSEHACVDGGGQLPEALQVPAPGAAASWIGSNWTRVSRWRLSFLGLFFFIAISFR
jgi:hypothetical protein